MKLHFFKKILARKNIRFVNIKMIFFRRDSEALKEGRFAAVQVGPTDYLSNFVMHGMLTVESGLNRQALSGTGALRIGFEFLHKYFPEADVYVPNPTWANHNAVIQVSAPCLK